MSIHPIRWRRAAVSSARRSRRLGGGPGLESLEGRLLLAGRLDPTFGQGGRVAVDFGYVDGSGRGPDASYGVAVQPDGKAVLAGVSWRGGEKDYDIAVTRLNLDGTLDPAFGTAGRTIVGFDLGGQNRDSGWAVALAPGGKIVIAGAAQTGPADAPRSVMAVVRLNPDGTPDATFDGDGRATIDFADLGFTDATAAGAVVQPDGKIVVAGEVTLPMSGARDFAVARLNVNGSLDASFSGDGRETIAFDLGGDGDDSGHAVALAPGGKIVLAGAARTGQPDSNIDIAVARLNSDGTLDATFDGDGRAVVPFSSDRSTDEYARSVAVQPDGKVVLAGNVRDGALSAFVVARLNADGLPDAAFGSNGRVAVDFNLGGDGHDVAQSVAIESNGRILIAGSARQDAPDRSDFAVARLHADGRLDQTFGAGGSQIFGLNLNGPKNDEAFGLALTPDGRAVVAGLAGRDDPYDTDFAAIRLILATSPGDYDGDGKTDLAVYGYGRLAYVPSSRPGTPAVQLRNGGPEDAALAGDYDGDGITDLAVYGYGRLAYQPSSRPGSPAVVVAFGGSEDQALPMTGRARRARRML